MKRLLFVPVMLMSLSPVQVNAHPLSLEERAIDLVIEKHDKRLKKSLEGTGKNPAYMAWTDDDCNVRIKAGTHQPATFSTLEWFDVNVCTKKVEKVCLLRGGCE